MTNRKRLIIIVIVLLVLIAIVVASVNARRKNQMEVQTDRVQRVENLVSKVNASGEINPREYVELQAEISGVITELYVKEGDHVSQGDLLVKIDPAQTAAETRAQQALLEVAILEASNQKAQINLQETNLARERANVRAAEADVQRARQAYEYARNNFVRKQELFEQNLISRDLYEAARNDMVAAEAAVHSADARLEQAQASLAVAQVVLEQAQNSYESSLSRIEQNRAILERTRDTLSKTTIRSPLTGVITQMNVEVGERAVPGTLNNPYATIMIIADLSVIEAEMEVDETDIVHVELGQEAEVNVDALPDQPLKGIVTEIGNSPIQTSGQQTQEAKDFKVTIRLENPPGSLRPGLSCTADITTAVRHDVLTIPIQALTAREFEIAEDGGPVIPEPGEKAAESKETREREREKEEFEGVFVVENGKAAFVPVKTGITGNTEIEIEDGLTDGAEVVTGSYKALRTLNHGDPVKVENGAGA